MIELILSPRLQSLCDPLDEAWETGMVEKLPFPVAFHLDHLRRENYPWDFLLKDMLHILLKYLSVVAVSDYLHSAGEPDYDINEQLQNLRINMSEGHWLRLLRNCSASKHGSLDREMMESFRKAESGPYQARIAWPETGLRTNDAGLLSTLVTLRNKLLGHGKSPSEADKQRITPVVAGLYRAVIELYRPLWEYDLVYRFDRHRVSEAFVLRGVRNFARPALPESAFPSRCFLAGDGKPSIDLSPLVLADKPALDSQVTLIDLQSEQYILEHLDSNLNPEYTGVGGSTLRKSQHRDELVQILDGKGVWQHRRDIELSGIPERVRARTLETLEDLEYNSIFKPGSYFHREATEVFFQAFLADEAHRALIVSGVPGCGKTTAVAHFVNSLLASGENVLLVRGIEMPERVQKPQEFERWIAEYLGFDGELEEILDHLAGNGKKFLLILDGINEFTAVGRDASKLFTQINHFLARRRKDPVLKILFTLRSDTLNFFLPGGRLPVDAIEELYFRPDGKDYYGIGVLDEAEGMSLLATLGVPGDQAGKIMRLLRQPLRTPQVLYKIANGAIIPEDLKGMDTLAITSKFLEKRLGRDKKLKAICTELVGAMAKTKDMNLTEAYLLEKAPKLYTKLTANRNRVLNVLADLEIIQQIRTEDSRGNPSTTLLLAHDTIFESLSRGVDNTMQRIRSRIGLAGMFLMILGLIMIYTTSSEEQDQKIESGAVHDNKLTDSLIGVMTFSGHVNVMTPEEKISVQEAYRKLNAAFKQTRTDYERAEQRNREIWMILFIVLFALILAGRKVIDRIFFKADRREARIRFFGRMEKLKMFKFFMRWYLISVVLMMILLLTVESLGLNESQTSVFLWVIGAGFTLIACLLPLIMARRALVKCKESPLIREFFLSPYGRRMIWLEQVLENGYGLVIIAGMTALFTVPVGIITREDDALKGRMKQALGTVDSAVISAYPLPDTLHAMKFYHTKGLSLTAQYGLPKMDLSEGVKAISSKMGWKDVSKVYRYGIFFLAMLIVLTLAINILPFEIAARRYYRRD